MKLGIVLTHPEDPQLTLIAGAPGDALPDQWELTLYRQFSSVGKPFPFQEALRFLRLQADGPESDLLIDGIWAIAGFLKDLSDFAGAREIVQGLVDSSYDSSLRAEGYGAIGSYYEREGDYESAAMSYSQSIAEAPGDQRRRYFGRNNLAYCLLQLGQHHKAEKFCREAILIDPHRHNAYKNLGLALWALGKLAEAAENLRTAAQIQPQDDRARLHLEELFLQHPELAKEAIENPAL